MKYGMVIDLKKCIGCYGCQIFCRAENATPPGGAWSRVLFYELGQYPDIKKMLEGSVSLPGKYDKLNRGRNDG